MFKQPRRIGVSRHFFPVLSTFQADSNRETRIVSIADIMDRKQIMEHFLGNSRIIMGYKAVVVIVF